MDIICDELGIPKQHIKETSIPDRYILIVNKLWLQLLERDHKIIEFPIYQNDSKNQQNKILPELGHPWTKVLIQNYKKSINNQKVQILPHQIHNNIQNEESSSATASILSYSEMLTYITTTNYKNLWEQSYQKYSKAHVKFTKNNHHHHHASSSNTAAATSITNKMKLTTTTTGGGATSIDNYLYDNILRELIQRIYQCNIINTKYDKMHQFNKSSNIIDDIYHDIHENILPAIIAIETTTYITIIFYPSIIETTLYDCITYSPAMILHQTYNKILFIFYQLIQLVKNLHQQNLLLGDIQLNDIYIKENLWLQIIPKLNTNIIHIPNLLETSNSNHNVNVPILDDTTIITTNTTPDDSLKFDLKFAYDLQQFTLHEYCEMWCLGQLTNYDYLTILNNAVGRKIGLPGYHHIMPWVTDFSQRNGIQWRDLNKTKYRINKGDAHLDLMFTTATLPNNHLNSEINHLTNNINHINHSGNNVPPHHVSDFLSEITYFVYMARRTSQNVLCQHVRPIWVPAEYPVSIQRLQEWTPDECIPEFYSDPMVFKSIHEDLPDLEIPVWATCPEDFIAKHREALESQYVSENLHSWIDLNFGYKLSGKAAIKSKNVCLSLVDNHKNLTQRGIVQLFAHAHPPKRFPSPWFGRVPPRIIPENDQLKRQTLARSSEDLTLNDNTNMTNLRRQQQPHRNRDRGDTMSNRRSSSNQRYLNDNSTYFGLTSNLQPDSHASSIERSTSLYQNVQNYSINPINSASALKAKTIYLPEDYNPLALLNSFENTEQFFAKTFLEQKSNTLSPLSEKLQQNDMLFDMESSDNSFTNRIFTESFEMQSVLLNSKTNNNKNALLVHNTIGRNNMKQISNTKMNKDLQTIGCLMVEVFLIHKLRPLTMNCCTAGLSFEKRLEACKMVALKYITDIPKCLQYAVKLLLNLNNPSNDIIITDRGLPQPTAKMLLEPILSNFIIPFPFDYYRIYSALKSLHNFEMTSNLLDLYTHFNCDGKSCLNYTNLDKKRVLYQRKISECKVKSFCKQTFGLLEPIAYEQFTSVELLLPYILDLINLEETSILSAWNLFDPIAAALGVRESQKYLLEPILKLYDAEGEEQQRTTDFWNKSFEMDSNYMKFRTSSSFKSRKSAKLYHHSFLLRLIVRFGLKCFLENFIPSLIEAVGGYKEPIESSGFHYHSNQTMATNNVRRSRSTKNLKFCCATDESDNSITLISPDHSDMKSDPTISICENNLPSASSIKPEIEDVFAFESELDDTNDITGRSSSATGGENQSIDSFDMPMGTTKAEEATEDGTNIYLAEKLAINDIICSGRLSNNSFDDDKISVTSSQKDSPHKLDLLGPKSPTIAIPNTYRRTYELSTIDCEIGSKKSVDSFDFGASVAAAAGTSKTTNNRNDESEQNPPNQNKTKTDESSDSLKASVIAKQAKSNTDDNGISEMSTKSLIWLSHRLGPVLTARYLTRNLLRMLTLCYVGQENLLPETCETEIINNLNYFSIADSKVVGDHSADKILECLMAITGLFGEQFILLQYLPHVSELIALSKKRITSSLEGAIISSLQLLKYIIPSLNDSTVMEHLQDLIIINIINPIINLVGTTQTLMPSSFLGRSVLARKLLDTIYVLCVRIGPEMSKEHLCPALQKFFLIFDKAYGISENFQQFPPDTTTIKENSICISPYAMLNEDLLNDNDLQFRERAVEEIRDVFSPNLAHCSYLAFLRFLGESIMVRTLLNLEFILTLCHEYEQPDYSGHHDRNKRRQNFTTNRVGGADGDIQDEEFIGSHSFGTFVVGNRIEVIHTTPKYEIGPMEVLDMVAYKTDQINTTRHLRGNWLAYWRHEISRSDKDTHLNLKQIKLQTFSGHTNSVRAILSLDNENSFMSASKDKTVKLWSLRSEGDGKKIKQCQFNYNSHKKSVHSLAFLEAMRLVVSCDSGVHIWDPFIGRPIGILDTHKHSPVSVVRTYPSPSPLVIAGTAESTVKIIDSRMVEYVNEWRVTTNQNSTVRCLACAPSGNWIAVGLSSGNIILLDGRTGTLMRSWKATDGELLQLVAPNDQQVISSSLDYSISVWNITDNYLQHHLKQPPEPAHCLYPNDTELIFATPANRIGVYSDFTSSDATYSITKLRSDTMKGVLTSFSILPLNRMILTGNDSGNIVLLC